MGSNAIKDLTTANDQVSTVADDNQDENLASEHFDEISGSIKWFDDIKGYGWFIFLSLCFTPSGNAVNGIDTREEEE